MPASENARGSYCQIKKCRRKFWSLRNTELIEVLREDPKRALEKKEWWKLERKSAERSQGH
jgi:hypothetical protein